MTKDELKEIGLTDEQVSKVFAMHGKEINKLRDNITDLKNSETGLKNDLADRNSEISDLKKLDAQGVQKKYDDLKTEYDNYKADVEKKSAQQKYNDRRSAFFKDTQFTDDYAKRGILSEFDEKKFEYSDKDNTFTGAKEWLEEVKKASPTSFKNASGGTPRIVTPGGKESSKPVTAEEFAKMKFADKIKFKQENPDGYEALKSAPPVQPKQE